MDKFHKLPESAPVVALPTAFTYPFHYIPHPLCIAVAEEVQRYLTQQEKWQEELQKGKMFGVLLVQTATGEVGFLAAFSGILAGKNQQDYFVPPVYDVQKPDSYFKKEENKISAINKQIQELESSLSYQECCQQLTQRKEQAKQAIQSWQEEMKRAKERRDQLRRHPVDGIDWEQLIRESQFQKAELKRQKQYWHDQLFALQTEIGQIEQEIDLLRNERKKRSAALQLWLFNQFQMRNARGEVRDLCDLFQETTQQIPPAGAGECAAPKLLQYAYRKGFHPLAMAEFWWGDSPKQEIRKHGYYYPSCQGKCAPILKHMLQGLEVEQNPLEREKQSIEKLEIVFEDAWLLVINKPAGMLSVPGKSEKDSIYWRIKLMYPEATGPLIVHRLDMATSGLLLIAKTKEVHQHLQAQFKNRTIHKIYIAWLDGLVQKQTGVIQLPLRPDPLDRPRQVVDHKQGKPAITDYQCLRQTANKTLVLFRPLTGRTHQLRVHAAHSQGLNIPIIGDELYGKQADRLYLHAQSLEFIHPITQEKIQVKKTADFDQKEWE